MRKIIQYYPHPDYIPAALCDDGTVWGINSRNEWGQLHPEIPQDSAVNKSRKDKICGNVVNASDSSFIIRFDGCNYRMCGMGVPEIGKLFIADSGKSICISDGSIFNARMILEEI
jgi:hypothetical protein